VTVRLGYVHDNDDPRSADQHRWLAQAYDPASTAHLADTGITAGWRCLEIGAGGGSIATWLAERVAPAGRVVATDIKPQQIPPAPGLTVLRHDVVRDPLPANTFDLVHARLVLLHLPRREAVLADLVRCLRPGGVLQLDEFDLGYGPGLLARDAPLYQRFLDAKYAALVAAGADPRWGARVPAAMRAAGLTDIDVRPHLDVWRPGSPGQRLLRHHSERLRDRLLAAGMTADELADLRAVLSDPSFLAASSVFYTVQGRRS
jgi:ubiquinone/menaquinone biosynthesis C-methylase UbiE